MLWVGLVLVTNQHWGPYEIFWIFLFFVCSWGLGVLWVGSDLRTKRPRGPYKLCVIFCVVVLVRVCFGLACGHEISAWSGINVDTAATTFENKCLCVLSFSSMMILFWIMFVLILVWVWFGLGVFWLPNNIEVHIAPFHVLFIFV